MINHHIPSSQRATILSVDSLFSELGSGVGQSGWGYLARRQGIGSAWVAAGAFLVLGIPLLALARRADPESDRFGAPAPAPGAVSRERRRRHAAARGHADLRVHGHRGLDAPRAGAGRGALQRRARGSRPAGRAARSTPRADTACAWRGTASSTCSSAPPRPSPRSRRRSARWPPTSSPTAPSSACGWGCTPARRSLGSAATGADYVGYDVHRAARIASAGHGGQVLLSEPVERCSCATRSPRASRCAISASTASRTSAAPSGSSSWSSTACPPTSRPIRSLDAVPNNLPDAGDQLRRARARDRRGREAVPAGARADADRPGRHGQDAAVAADRGAGGGRLPGRRHLRRAGADQRSRAGGARRSWRPCTSRPGRARRATGCCSTFAIGRRCW